MSGRPATIRDVTIRGVTYPTIAHAARALGVQPQTIAKARQRGTLERVGLGKAHNLTPCRVRGRLYPSITAAAHDLGVDVGTVRRALERGREDRAGLRDSSTNYRACLAKPVTICGMTFPSRRQASIALGYHEDRVSYILRSGSTAEREGLIARAMRLACERRAA